MCKKTFPFPCSFLFSHSHFSCGSSAAELRTHFLAAAFPPIVVPQNRHCLKPVIVRQTYMQPKVLKEFQGPPNKQTRGLRVTSNVSAHIFRQTNTFKSCDICSVTGPTRLFTRTFICRYAAGFCCSVLRKHSCVKHKRTGANTQTDAFLSCPGVVGGDVSHSCVHISLELRGDAKCPLIVPARITV